ncbi:MAG: hypothetical protein M3Q95_04290 [Bacteroidota bacterium]|nr:hypothetical protein [Bacteroidota bacterium]
MDVRQQIRNAAPIIVMAYAFTTAILSVVIFLGMENNVELDHFTQDPASIMNTPFYLGFFSYVGILFWCASATLCFFTRLLLHEEDPAQKRKRQFLLYSGLISTLLMFDDLFLLHEVVFPEYFMLPKNVVYLIYLNILAAYVVVFRTDILETEFLILGIAFGLLGISQFVDSLPMPIPEDSFLEDAVKLFGIVTWFTYYMRYCVQRVRSQEEENN